MNFPNETDQAIWLALRVEQHQLAIRAKALAERVAFADLPANEQKTYIRLALEALRKERAS